ncbi:dynamin family protein [Prochlorothrix hollandica]|uniref:GTPase n=1 Tax=Prochlorothrix hollandica PCC 9006 = CALU 1027 TaxID=317619 RepID=A0A0M2PXW0_PROHO|nr:dynamin family protein [Prochlorothrix hollandica]KKJ01276.1 GTPase [Prochlorothrix hollandica PCC 9006 = CALU 1027]
MTQPIYNIFQEVEAKGRVLANYWQGFYEEIAQHLPESYQDEMAELSKKLELALAHLIDELHSPTLTLATTGTTSSGKSTLVNFLCGAEIVPVATSEMSAGVVTIEYSRDKALIIEETPGAAWECGQWYGISDQEIYDRLHDVMITYIDRREEQPSLACPQSLIYYPFRLMKDLGLELPSGTKVRILDLPGLAYVGDEGNASVIRQCREALCLVTYNSAETDSQKVQNLLQEVVSQVKDLGGSPARMLFILNRIDVFRADRSWPTSEERFVDKATQSIKGELLAQLQEYTPEIESLQVIKLSTWPALLALQSRSSDLLTSMDACKRADNHFNGLLEEILEDLPRSVQKWSDHDRHRVADLLWQKSYGGNFQTALHQHIGYHFPQLVIPQMIDRFNVTAGNAVVEWAVQTTSAILNSSQEKYEQECTNLEKIQDQLETLLDSSDAKLREPFKKVSTAALAEGQTEDLRKVLENAVTELQKSEPYSLLNTKLAPLYDWETQIGLGLNAILESVAESIRLGNDNLDNLYFRQADPTSLKQLKNSIETLVALGYTGSIARDGEDRIAKTATEQRDLKLLNKALDALSYALTQVMSDIFREICQQQSDRIYESVNSLFECHLYDLEAKAQNTAPNMAVKFPTSFLVKLENKPKISIEFKAGFSTTKGTWNDEIRVEGRERLWYTLWIVEVTTYKTEIVTRESDNASIPSVVELLRGWLEQAKDSRSGIVASIAPWIINQIDLLKKNINSVQNEVLDRYKIRLNRAHQEFTLTHEKEKNIWEPLNRKSLDMQQEFSQLDHQLDHQE